MATATDSSPHPAPDREQRAPWKSWLAVLTVAVGIFSLVTAEQLPVGLLTSVGSSLDVSEGTAGLMVTVPGIVAGVSAPLVPLLAGSLDRRWLLAALMLLMAAAHLVSTVAPNFAVLLTSRVLVGLSIGGFWAIAGGLATRLVPQRSVARATSLVFSGVAAANVLGVPMGTLIGELAGWRTAFAALGGLGAVVLLGLLVLLPHLPASEPVRVRALAQQFGNTGVRRAALATFLVVTGHFAAYTFVSPVLQRLSGIDSGMISQLLLVYGAAGLVGNFLVGAAVARDVRRTMLTISAALTVILVLFPLLGGNGIGGTVLLVLWGLAFGGVSVSLQTWVIKAAPAAVEAATSLYVFVFNTSIALGALLGGIVVDSLTLTAALWFGGALVLLMGLTAAGLRKAQLASTES
ncbi:putative MFS family arabinose efflux permease [Haloactinospora alba]|uniref:Putative MFS family arabinose efflux permease n=1 Tax=Haloactinospora alba TaxID=405555 RepID=A0A543NNA3_9ACTN|nr:MFS transporter [Haloactinospora alba]TQN33303.1 putative MFS family arabinose efflux permease [Haloactinospora alba]